LTQETNMANINIIQVMPATANFAPCHTTRCCHLANFNGMTLESLLIYSETGRCITRCACLLPQLTAGAQSSLTELVGSG